MEKNNFELIKKIAIKKGGKCISNKYLGSGIKLKFVCKEGHEWEALPYNILKDHWCKSCSMRKAKLKYNIEKINRILKPKGIKCISKEYVDCKKPMKFVCKEGHKWFGTWDNVRSKNSGCPKCQRIKQNKIEIEKGRKSFIELIKKNKGQILSPYVNSRTKVKLQCKHKHDPWLVKPNGVQQGGWCPTCRSQKFRENACRKIFEHLFDSEFPPKWFINSDGKKSELDGLSKELKIAFEHHGEQHFREIRHFHQTRSLTDQKRSDILKIKYCKENKINLIIIPYYIKLEDLENWIRSELIEKKISFKSKFKITVNDLGIVFEDKLIEVMKKAKLVNLTLLSKKYNGSHHKLEFRCNKGHIVFRSPTNLDKKTRCPICAGVQGTYKQMYDLASSKGLVVLSKKYVGSKERYKFKCIKKGHVFTHLYVTLHKSKGCPICRNELSVQNLRKSGAKRTKTIIQNMGGKQITEFVNANTPVKIVCKYGNEFSMRPTSLYKGRWCRCQYCTKKK